MKDESKEKGGSISDRYSVIGIQSVLLITGYRKLVSVTKVSPWQYGIE
jgi:hypothetical protein